jgi:hypothetical protein
MIGIADPARAETVAAGALACPGCTRPLHPWGHAPVPARFATTASRRWRCAAAGPLPHLPGHPCAAARGDHAAPGRLHRGHRVGVAGQRPRDRVPDGLPPSSTDRCPRCGDGSAVRDHAHVEWLRTQGMVWLSQVDLDVINTLAPQATRLGDALAATAAAALTLRPWSSRTSHRGRWSGRSPNGRLLGMPVPHLGTTPVGPPKANPARTRPPPATGRRPDTRRHGEHPRPQRMN